MGQDGKAVMVILVMLLILTFAGAGAGFYFYQEEKLRIIALNEELESLKVEKRIAESQLAKSKENIEQLEAQLGLANAQVEDLNNKFEEIKGEKDLFYSDVENLQSQLKKQKEIEVDWATRYRQAQAEINRLQAALERTTEDLQAQVSKLKTKGKVELGKIVVEQESVTKDTLEESLPVQKEAGTKALTLLAGKVLVVNDDYDFAVINLGAQDGVDVNDVFSVYHDDTYVGDIKVDKTQEIMSACVFESREIEEKISEGDKVIRK